MAKNRPSIHIGTSGWYYGHWQGPFYPSELPKSKFLEHYTGLFHTVEINSSFYRLPGEQMLTRWRSVCPANFIFSVKASRYLTHLKRLKDAGAGLERFLDRIRILKENLGPILFQLPPRFGVNPVRLQQFLAELPDSHRYAFEFRNQSWFRKDTYELLKRHNAAFCIYDFKQAPSPREVTADFVYIRLHGPQEQAYSGRYGRQQLTGWAGAFREWVQKGQEIFCYFDNDQNAYAVQDALDLQEMTGS